MASAFCTGPCFIYVGIGSGGSPLFLGTGERGPRVRGKRHWHPLANDAAGDEPYDWSYQGASAMVSLVLTRWNEAVFAQLEAMPNPFTGVRGFEAFGDIGSLQMTEGLGFALWLQYPYATKAAFAGAVGGPMPPGRRYLRAFSLFEQLEPGVKPYKVNPTFYCMRQYVPSTGTFALFDQNFAGIPQVPGN